MLEKRQLNEAFNVTSRIIEWCMWNVPLRKALSKTRFQTVIKEKPITSLRIVAAAAGYLMQTEMSHENATIDNLTTG